MKTLTGLLNIRLAELLKFHLPKTTTAGSPTVYSKVGNNENVLNEAFPKFFNLNGEDFAEETAITNGYSDGPPIALDPYYSYFPCSKILVTNAEYSGIVPPANTLAGYGCPAK
jgi:hypothetical protein